MQNCSSNSKAASVPVRRKRMFSRGMFFPGVEQANLAVAANRRASRSMFFSPAENGFCWQGTSKGGEGYPQPMTATSASCVDLPKFLLAIRSNRNAGRNMITKYALGLLAVARLALCMLKASKALDHVNDYMQVDVLRRGALTQQTVWKIWNGGMHCNTHAAVNQKCDAANVSACCVSTRISLRRRGLAPSAPRNRAVICRRCCDRCRRLAPARARSSGPCAAATA